MDPGTAIGLPLCLAAQWYFCAIADFWACDRAIVRVGLKDFFMSFLMALPKAWYLVLLAEELLRPVRVVLGRAGVVALRL